MSYDVGRRRSSDPVWLWCRLASTAPTRPLAWEAPYAMGAALEKPKKKRERERGRENLTAAAGVAAEVRVQSQTWHRG